MKRGQQPTADKRNEPHQGTRGGQPTLVVADICMCTMWHVCLYRSVGAKCEHSGDEMQSAGDHLAALPTATSCAQYHIHTTAATSKALSAAAVRHFAETRQAYALGCTLLPVCCLIPVCLCRLTLQKQAHAGVPPRSHPMTDSPNTPLFEGFSVSRHAHTHPLCSYTHRMYKPLSAHTPQHTRDLHMASALAVHLLTHTSTHGTQAAASTRSAWASSKSAAVHGYKPICSARGKRQGMQETQSTHTTCYAIAEHLT